MLCKRKYYRKCGICGHRDKQPEMVRVSSEYSDNGWLCKECYDEITSEQYFETVYDNEF